MECKYNIYIYIYCYSVYFIIHSMSVIESNPHERDFIYPYNDHLHRG